MDRENKRGPREQDTLPSEILFPVVGIGASAGGLEPMEELFGEFSKEPAMAFVVIQHSDPARESLLPVILSRRTALTVVKAEDGAEIEINHIYVCPSDAVLTFSERRLRLVTRTVLDHVPVTSIDQCFRSLAAEFQNCAVAVVLSGTGSDGSLGLQEVKSRGGITFAQDAQSAKFSSMPQCAIATGAVDFVLGPREIARHLEKVARQGYSTRHPSASGQEAPSEEADAFESLIKLIHQHAGIDFSHYKRGTVSRRIARRMALHGIERPTDFLAYLKRTPEALHEIAQDILIQVTKFFREPEAFDILKERVFPRLVENRPKGDPIRGWVPGCSSGEEVYSILIALIEFLEDGGHHFPVQIFGTDLNEGAIAKARAAAYVENIALDVSPERLRRFFTKVGNRYEIQQSLRDICVFAKHNVVSDPPFSRLDFVSCRNVLIYLEPTLQGRALSIFHFALNPQGILFLGSAETVGAVPDLFAPLDTRFRIYAKQPQANRLHFDFAGAQKTAGKMTVTTSTTTPGENASKGMQMQRDADRYLLGEFCPSGALVNEKLELVQFRGKTGLYFEPSPGFANLELLGMLKEGLSADVRKALETAKKKKAPVRKEGIKVRTEGTVRRVAIEVIPLSLPSTGERYFILLFEEMDQPAFKETKGRRNRRKTSKQKQEEEEELSAVRSELSTMKEYLQSVNEEKEATNEELKAANEEIMSSNEELQSTNEELHSAKEELQSTNEELMTVNDEMKLRNQDLSILNDDLTNLFHSLNSALVILTKDLRVRRFTPMAETLLRLVPTDIGRSISHIRPTIEIKDLEKLLLEVITTVRAKEMEVEDTQGKWYTVQMKPYRTADDRIDGVVLLFTDIDKLKTSLIYSEAVEAIVAHPLLVLSSDLRVKRANQQFYSIFKTTPEETENRFLFSLGNGQWNIPELKTLLDEVLPKDCAFTNFEVTRDFPGLGRKTMHLRGRRLLYREKATETILLSIEVEE